MENWILRFTLVDHPDQPILVRISRKDGGQALDLDLLATDGDNAYRGKVRHSKVQKHKSSSYEGTDDEWYKILQHVLLLKPEINLPASVRDNLECTCDVRVNEKTSNLSIIMRTRVEDITHRLGSIDLKHSDNTDDVDLFAWTNQVVQSRDDLSSTVRKGEDEIEKAASTIKTLEKQLQDLFQAKEDHESQLLAKFTLLLNEKKLRIRAQQRQLVDHEQPTDVSGPQHGTSHKRKRRVNDEELHDEDDSDESEGFENMEIDHSTNQLSGGDREDTQSTASDLDQRPETSNNNVNQTNASSEPPAATPPPRSLPFPSTDHNFSPMKIDSIGRKQSGGRYDGASEDDQTASDTDDEL